MCLLIQFSAMEKAHLKRTEDMGTGSLNIYIQYISIFEQEYEPVTAWLVPGSRIQSSDRNSRVNQST